MASVPSSHLFSSDGEGGRGHSHTWLPQLSPAKVIVTLSSLPLLIHCFCIKFHFCCPFFFPPLAPLVGGGLMKTGGSYPLIKKTLSQLQRRLKKEYRLDVSPYFLLSPPFMLNDFTNLPFAQQLNNCSQIPHFGGTFVPHLELQQKFQEE